MCQKFDGGTIAFGSWFVFFLALKKKARTTNEKFKIFFILNSGTPSPAPPVPALPAG